MLNDGVEDRLLHNRRVRISERLVRRILDQPHAPAVVLVNVRGPRGRARTFGGARDDTGPASSCRLPSDYLLPAEWQRQGPPWG